MPIASLLKVDSPPPKKKLCFATKVQAPKVAKGHELVCVCVWMSKHPSELVGLLLIPFQPPKKTHTHTHKGTLIVIGAPIPVFAWFSLNVFHPQTRGGVASKIFEPRLWPLRGIAGHRGAAPVVSKPGVSGFEAT